MPLPLADRILAIFEKGLSAYETHIATRQEAYERKMDKNLRRANSWAGTAFRRLTETGGDMKDRQFLKAKKFFYKFRMRT